MIHFQLYVHSVYVTKWNSASESIERVTPCSTTQNKQKILCSLDCALFGCAKCRSIMHTMISIMIHMQMC